MNLKTRIITPESQIPHPKPQSDTLCMHVLPELTLCHDPRCDSTRTLCPQSESTTSPSGTPPCWRQCTFSPPQNQAMMHRGEKGGSTLVASTSKKRSCFRWVQPPRLFGRWCRDLTPPRAQTGPEVPEGSQWALLLLDRPVVAPKDR